MANMSTLSTAYASHGESRITQLPGELLTNILSYLSTHDLVHCLQVSKPWASQALACESLWRQMSMTNGPDYRVLPQVSPFVRNLFVISHTRQALRCVTRILSSPETIFVGLRSVALFIHESMDQAAVNRLAQALAIIGKQLEAVELGYFDSACSATLAETVLAPCPNVTHVAYSIHGDEPFAAAAARPRHPVLVTTRMLTHLCIQTDARISADQIRLVLSAAPCLRRLSLNVCNYDAIAVVADHASLVHLDFNYYDNGDSNSNSTSWHQQQTITEAHLPSTTTTTTSNRCRSIGLKVVHLGWVTPNDIDLIASLLIRHRTTLEDLAIKERLGNRHGRPSPAWWQLTPDAQHATTAAPFFPRLTTATLSVPWDTPVLTSILNHCPALASLSMAHMHTIQGPPLFETLGTLPCLEHLTMDACAGIASGLEAYLRSQPRLRKVALYGNLPALTGGALNALGAVANLRCIQLGQMDSHVRLDAWVESVGILEELWLSNMASVDDATLLKLGNHVIQLHLDMLWSITDQGLASFVEHATTTQELHVSLCPAISKKAAWATESKMRIFVKDQ